MQNVENFATQVISHKMFNFSLSVCCSIKVCYLLFSELYFSFSYSNMYLCIVLGVNQCVRKDINRSLDVKTYN